MSKIIKMLVHLKAQNGSVTKRTKFCQRQKAHFRRTKNISTTVHFLKERRISSAHYSKTNTASPSSIQKTSTY